MSQVALAVQSVWVPQPGTQSSAILASWCDELFFGGARGGGKSDYLLGDYLQGIKHGKKWRGIMFRKTMGELEELQIRATEIFPAHGGVYKIQSSVNYPFTNCWYFPDGATLKMRYLEHERDADNYQGHQYTWIGFDELTNHATPKAYDKLKACLRNPHGIHGRIRASGNPGGKGHIWVKARFIDIVAPFTPYTDPKTGLVRMYIPSRITDNMYLKDNEQYKAMVKSSGSEELVKAWMDGNWDIIAGAYFDCWSRDRHVIKPFIIPKEWTRFRAFDWGSAKPFSVGWWAIASDDFFLTNGMMIPKGALVRYREWYGMKKGEDNVGLKLTAEAVAEGIKKLDDKSEEFAYSVADPACWKVDGGESVAERMRKKGVMFRRADNTRINGWDQMRDRMVGEDDMPMIYTFDTCIDSIRTIPALQHDPNKAEDIDTDMEDHCFAAGTLVNTIHGKVTIEDLPESGFVLSEGGYRYYRSARLVKKSAEVLRLKFSDGTKVICTPDHKFLEDTDDWRYAYDLTNRRIKCASTSSVKRYKSLMRTVITYAAITFRRKAGGCIEQFGSFIMEPFKMDSMCITQMVIEQTIKSKTCNVSVTSSICQESMVWSLEKGELKALRLQELPLENGMVQQKVENGTQNTTISTSEINLSAQLMQLANNAAKLIRSTFTSNIKANTAETTARLVRCVSVERLSERQDVYCLTVPSNGRFSIESGMIVSNCSDEWRYACMSRPYVRAGKAKKKKVEVGTIGWVYANSKEEKVVSKYRS
jgi:hypothetical protein